MIVLRREAFEAVLSQLKKIVIRSNMYATYLLE